MQDRKFVFVMDYLPSKVNGGAELSSQALLELCPTEAIVIESSEVDSKTIEQYKDRYWIFTNIWLMKFGLMPLIARVLNYSIVEYDYKYCAYRSPDMHVLAEGIQCHCTNIILDDFFANANEIFFMSERQRQWHIAKMPFIDGKSTVLSSIFSAETIYRLNWLYSDSKEKKEDCWAIVFSRSALKGFNEAVSYADNEGLNYKIFKDLDYDDLLVKISRCKGLIYKPIGGDTCPRLVIEARILGLELDMNYFVQHKDEEWFNGHLNTVIEHLRTNKITFWNKVVEYANQQKVCV